MTWQRFRRTGSVTAERLDSPLVWHTEGGYELVGQPGDWRLEDEDGHWTVLDDAFTAGYEPCDGVHRRRGTVLARRGCLGEVVETLEGDVKVGPGDWVVEGLRGELWVVPSSRFARTHLPLIAPDVKRA